MILLKEIVKAYYDLDIIEIIPYSVPTGYNELYKVKISTNEYFALKVHLDRFVHDNQIEAQDVFKRLLRSSNIPAVPYIPTIEFKHSIMVNHTIITLEPWCERIMVVKNEFPFLKKLLQMMAKMHLVSEKSETINVSNGTRWRIFGENKTNSLRDYDEIDLNFKVIIDKFPEVYGGYTRVLKALIPLWHILPSGIVHGDLSLNNCSFDDMNNINGIFDFNLIGMDKFVNELVQTTLMNVYFNRSEAISYERGLIEIAELINTYEAIRKLSDVENQAMQLIFRLSFISNFGLSLPLNIINSILEGDYDGVVRTK